MEDDDQKELQLLPASQSVPSSSRPFDASIRYRSKGHHHHPLFEGTTPSLDLQLSISLRPIRSSPADNNRNVLGGPLCICDDDDDDEDDHDRDGDDDRKKKYKAAGRECVEAMKWQAAEQIRAAAMEKAYAERVRELTKREMELAQSEFTRARHMWERAREEVEKAERMKERATRQIDSTCMEITCQACRQSFRP
ncbi:hypothetical protein UlMin_007686 [Ulmus minor]